MAGRTTRLLRSLITATSRSARGQCMQNGRPAAVFAWTHQPQVASGSAWHCTSPPYPSFQSSISPWHSQQRFQHCCPGLGGTPPEVVYVEFDPEEVDRFIAMADAIEAAFPGVVVEGNADGDGRSGSFEIKSAAGELLFSRLDSGAWPQEVAIVQALQAAADGGACSLTEAKQ